MRAFRKLVAPNGAAEINYKAVPLSLKVFAALNDCVEGREPSSTPGGVTLRFDCHSATFPADSLLVVKFSGDKISKVEMNKTLYVPPLPPGFSDPREYYQRSKLIVDSALQGDDSVLRESGLTSGQIHVAPSTLDHRPPMALTAQNLRELFTKCTREGQIQVDKSGASTSYRCSNPTLNGLYSVDFDYIGQRLYRYESSPF